MLTREKKSVYQSGFTSGICSACPLRNQKGQAIIEYVLILIISVSLILTLASNFFKPMEKFMQSFMGEYVQCLLETGALPSFGSDSTNTAESLGCTLPTLEGSTGKSATKGASSSHSDQNGDAGAVGNKSASSSGNNTGSTSSGTYAGSASRGGGSYLNSNSSNKASKGIDGSVSNGKTTQVSVDGIGGGGFFRGSVNRGGSFNRNSRRLVSINISGISELDKKKLAKNRESNRSIVLSSELPTPVKKIAVKKPDKKIEIKADDEPMTIGNFIRYLFIAALVIALIIFVGGQVLSMSDGRET